MEKGIPLATQKYNTLQKRYDTLFKNYARLEELYSRLDDDYKKLAAFKMRDSMDLLHLLEQIINKYSKR
jgi:hypothetical protein